MTQYETPGPQGPSERWNVNMPAVIGVVFVFLVGVIVWVIASGDDDPEATSASSTTATTAPVTDPTVETTAVTTTTTTPTSTVPETSTSTLPETTLATTTVPETTAAPVPTTTVPVTTAPGADPGAVPGDLGIPGRPMQQPPCDGGYITIVASAVGDQATADGVAAVLEAFPGTEYLRTDQTCSSLRPDVDGQPIYVVYFGPFAFPIDACTARADGAEGAYVKQLSNDVSPDQIVPCE